jgi:uncharacterized protein YggE
VGAAIAALTLVAIIAPTAGLTQTDATPQDTVTVTAAGKVEGRPDLAAISFGIAGKADSASAAMDELTAEQNSVIEALRSEAGLAEDQVTTGNVSLGRACHYDRSLDRTVCQGYRAHTSVRAETDDLDVVGDIIDIGVDAGASSVNDVSFERTSEDDAIKEALAQAMDLATAKAETLATGAGRQLGRALVIEEGGAQRPVFSTSDVAFGTASGGSSASLVINPADHITKVRIVVTFALN